MSELGQQLISIVRRKATEAPMHIYEPPPHRCIDSDGIAHSLRGACVYILDGRPSCLIGQALYGAGLIDESLETSGHNSNSFTGLMDRHVWDLGGAEVDWLRTVQRFQDAGQPWGSCVTLADAGAEEPITTGFDL